MQPGEGSHNWDLPTSSINPQQFDHPQQSYPSSHSLSSRDQFDTKSGVKEGDESDESTTEDQLLSVLMQQQQQDYGEHPGEAGMAENAHKGFKKRSWVSSEDAILKGLVDVHGPKEWNYIAGQLQGRSAKQCCERWHNYLKPNIRKDAWRPEEDKLIMEYHHAFCNKWSKIAEFLPGRTGNAVKNRFYCLMRRDRKNGGPGHMAHSMAMEPQQPPQHIQHHDGSGGGGAAPPSCHPPPPPSVQQQHQQHPPPARDQHCQQDAQQQSSYLHPSHPHHHQIPCFPPPPGGGGGFHLAQLHSSHPQNGFAPSPAYAPMMVGGGGNGRQDMPSWIAWGQQQQARQSPVNSMYFGAANKYVSNNDANHAKEPTTGVAVLQQQQQQYPIQQQQQQPEEQQSQQKQQQHLQRQQQQGQEQPTNVYGTNNNMNPSSLPQQSHPPSPAFGEPHHHLSTKGGSPVTFYPLGGMFACDNPPHHSAANVYMGSNGRMPTPTSHFNLPPSSASPSPSPGRPALKVEGVAAVEVEGAAAGWKEALVPPPFLAAAGGTPRTIQTLLFTSASRSSSPVKLKAADHGGAGGADSSTSGDGAATADVKSYEREEDQQGGLEEEQDEKVGGNDAVHDRNGSISDNGIIGSEGGERHEGEGGGEEDSSSSS